MEIRSTRNTCSYFLLKRGSIIMVVVTSSDIAYGKSIKVGDVLIVGEKKETGVEQGESSDIQACVNGNAERRRVFLRSAKKPLKCLCGVPRMGNCRRLC